MGTRGWWRVSSFGYKFCTPLRTDKTLVLDARTVGNPYTHGVSDDELRARVLADPAALAMVDRACEFLRNANGGIVLVGCSYGRHRSVAIADEISRRMRAWNDEDWEPQA